MEGFLKFVLQALSVIVGLFVWGFLKPYMGKKGENLATKEDLEDAIEKVRRETQTIKEAEIVAIQNKLDTVVEQNTAIVRSSEEIKDQISSRQRMWELKREAAYDILKLIASFSHALTVAIAVSDSLNNDAKAQMLKDTASRHAEYNEKLWQLKGIASLLFTKDLADLIGKISAEGTNLMGKAERGFPMTTLMEQLVIFQGLHDRISASLQKELMKG